MKYNFLIILFQERVFINQMKWKCHYRSTGRVCLRATRTTATLLPATSSPTISSISWLLWSPSYTSIYDLQIMKSQLSPPPTSPSPHPPRPAPPSSPSPSSICDLLTCKNHKEPKNRLLHLLAITTSRLLAYRSTSYLSWPLTHLSPALILQWKLSQTVQLSFAKKNWNNHWSSF